MKRHPTLTGDAFDQAVADAAECKALRYHRLEVIPGDPTKRPSFGALITLRCERCGTVRYDIVSRLTGELLYRSYDSPDWYLDAGTAGDGTTAWWRATYWSSLDASLFIEAEPTGRRKGTRS